MEENATGAGHFRNANMNFGRGSHQTHSINLRASTSTGLSQEPYPAQFAHQQREVMDKHYKTDRLVKEIHSVGFHRKSKSHMNLFGKPTNRLPPKMNQ